MAKTQYNADSITVLEGLEAVRKRPGMYIGSVGTKGLNHLIYEIVDNAVDEHLAGFCNQIWVTLEADGSCTVRDAGRGIPVEMHKKGMSAERIVLSTLHAGGKFDNDAYKTSGGLHGVGSSVVNALSERMSVKVYKNGLIHHDAYERGIPTVELVDGLLPTRGKTKETGTEINFLPDGEIFEKTRFKAEWLKSRLHETAYLNPNLQITYQNKRGGEEETILFHEPEGIISYVKELNSGKAPVHDPIYYKGTIDKVEVEVAFQFVDTFEENILGFCNNIFTQEGGTHLAGFKTRFTQMINSYARELGILKEKDANFTGADTRNGMTAVVAVKHPDPIFEGQTKTKLASADATKAVFTVTGDELQRYFDRNLEILKAVISCAEKSAKIRKAEEKAKTNMLSKSKFSFDSNGKLANCESRDASMDKVLANAEIKTMINAFGCGFSEGYGNDFDITKLRYHKIILMTDADVDGSHIDTLLLTFLYRFMPELIYDGHVFIAMPPLFKVIPKRGEEQYLYDEKELERYRKTHTGDFTLQRYKGLGEMDAQQLWETTLDPEHRVLKQVEIEDARMASEITEMLMGSDVPPRRQFIYEHADEAEIDA